MSSVVDATDPGSRDVAVTAAVEAVRAGDIVVIPTDTVYGVGCDAFDAAAVGKVLAAKGRGREMPPPVLIPNVATVEGLARDVPAYARALMERFWPGPLTVVLTAQSSLMWDLGETNGTVALRVPDNDVALAVLGAVGPMAVTSANTTGEPPATTAAAAQQQLGDAVSVYVDGGAAAGGPASTIVDCTGVDPIVLRPGPITGDEVDEVAAQVRRHATQQVSSAWPGMPAEQSAADAAPAGSAAAPVASGTSAAAGTEASGRLSRTGPRIAGRRRR
jgi:L-threonylcarbamoyladenylate synthase